MSNLTRKLRLLDVFCIASGAMVSSGLFVLPGIAHAQAGPAVIFSYFLAGILATTGMLSVAEIITAMPRAGGDYFFITRTIGPAAGTAAGILSWFSLALKSSFALVGMAAFLRLVVPVDPLLISTSTCLLFIFLNIFGIKEASRLQVFLLIGLLFLMILYVVFGIDAVRTEFLTPFVPMGWNAVFSTTGLVFISYGGLLKIAAISEEVKDPGKVIPMGMILSLVVIVIFYSLMVFITVGVLPSERLDHSLTPISDGAFIFFGGTGRSVMIVAALLAFVSTANAGLMSASRYLLSLSRDGLIPPLLGRVNEKFHTPHVSVLVTGTLMLTSLFLKLEMLVKVASTVLVLTYIFSNLCVIVLRESRLLNYQPMFRAPFYPWLQIFGTLGLVLVLLEMGSDALLISLLLVFGALLFYWLYGRIKSEREYALLHLIERFSDRKLSKGVLESELKEILRERDQLCIDRFEEITERAVLVDIPGLLNQEQFFKHLAEKLDGKFGFKMEFILNSLVRREKSGSTVILPGIAVSDIIVEGKSFFEMVLVRARGGLIFDNESSPVHAFFLLLTSEDERNFYLRAVTSIAQIIQEPSFKQKWKNVKTLSGLRDLILLGPRQRLCEIEDSTVPPGSS
jgi:amino acid transporter/mannitol/fructose-specific phosphotransferase system IIA component (Ntr-type)